MAAWPGPRAAARGVVHDLREGVAHLWHHRKAFDALAIVGAQRFGYGVVTVTTILLCRNTFAAAADPDAGARRISTVAVATGLGLLTGALLTPAGHRRTTAKWWIVGCSTLAGVAVLGFSTSLTFPVVLVAGYLVGLAMQGSKICIDATVQGAVDDEARGRVMSLYDLTFNLAFLAAVTVCALLVPPSGLAAGVVVMVAAVFLAAAAVYSRSTGRTSSGDTRDEELG
jgi:MFS family permease